MTVLAFPVKHDPWLSKRELARFLGFSTRWVELRMREGLPGEMIAGARRYKLSAVQEWLRSREEEG